MRKKHWLTYILIITALFIDGALWYFTMYLPHSSHPFEGEIMPSVFQGNYRVDGGALTPLDGAIQVPLGTQQVVLTGNFTALPGEGESFFFKTANLDVVVEVNNKEVWQHKAGKLFGVYLDGNDYYRKWQPANALTANDTVRIILNNNSNDVPMPLFNAFLGRIYVGTELELYAALLKHNFWFLILGGVVICSGLVTALIRLGLGKVDNAMKDQLFFYSVLAIGGGFWGIRNNDISRLLFVPYPYFNRFISSLGVSLFFLFLILYVRLFLHDTKSKKYILYIDNGLCLIYVGLLSSSFVPHTGYAFDSVGVWLSSAVALNLTLLCCCYDWLKTKTINNMSTILLLVPVVVGVSVDSYSLLRGELYYFDDFFVTDIIFLIFLLIQLGILIYHLNASYGRLTELNKLEKELQQQHIAVMLSQIQPHFLYNALTSIRYLCSENPQEAEIAIVHFSRFLRGNMGSLSQKAPIVFQQELEHLENYLFIEKLRFGEKIKVVYALQEKSFFLPALTLQPIVENSIRHGIQPKKAGGTIFIETAARDNGVIITIRDDGVGYDTKAPYGEGKNHIGLANTKARVKAMCNGSLVVKSEIGVGTVVTISIPLHPA